MVVALCLTVTPHPDWSSVYTMRSVCLNARSGERKIEGGVFQQGYQFGLHET